MDNQSMQTAKNEHGIQKGLLEVSQTTFLRLSPSLVDQTLFL
jgi:hypothetical protein